MEKGVNKSLYTVIAIVVFGIFLSLSYILYGDQMKALIDDIFYKFGITTDSKLNSGLALTPVTDDSLNLWFETDGFVANDSWLDKTGESELTSHNFDNTEYSGLNGVYVVFDGVNDYISIPHNDKLAPTDALSLEILVSGDMTKIDRFMYLISKNENGGYSLEITEAKNLRFLLKVNGEYNSLEVPISDLDANSNQIVGTFDGKTMSLYNNDRLLKAYEFGSTHKIEYSYNNALIIGDGASKGALPESGDAILGGLGIKFARIYTKALTVDEICQNYRYDQLNY